MIEYVKIEFEKYFGWLKIEKEMKYFINDNRIGDNEIEK